MKEAQRIKSEKGRMMESWEGNGKKEEREEEERNIVRSKTKEGLLDHKFKVRVILIAMYNSSNSERKRLPFTFLLSSTTFTLASV